MFSEHSGRGRRRRCIPAGQRADIQVFLAENARCRGCAAAPRRARPGRRRQPHTDIVPSINATLDGRTSPAGCDGRPQAADSTTLRRWWLSGVTSKSSALKPSSWMKLDNNKTRHQRGNLSRSTLNSAGSIYLSSRSINFCLKVKSRFFKLIGRGTSHNRLINWNIVVQLHKSLFFS